MTTVLAPLRRGWNMRPWRSSPLMGWGYRVEGVVTALLAVFVVAAIPAATVFGIAVYRTVIEHSVIAPGMHRIDAIADEPSPTGLRSMEAFGVKAHWTEGGRTHTDTVDPPSAVARGEAVSIWVDAKGDRVADPMRRSQALPDGIASGIAVFAVAVASALILRWGCARLLQRRRCAAWEHEWAALASVRKWNIR